MTFEQWLCATIDESAGLSAQTLCRRLAPLVTDAGPARHWLAGRVAAMAHDQPLLPAGYADPVCQSVVMLDHDRVHLSLAILSARAWNAQRESRRDVPDIIGFADGWTAIRFLSAPQATIQRFWLEQTDTRWKAEPEAPETAAADRPIYLDNAREAMRFVHLGSDVVMARLLVRDRDTEQAIECDARTGEALRVREAQSCHGRTRMTISLLRSLGRSDAVPIIARDLASWPAHLRWHGVREALAMDSLAGLRLLEQMAAHDPDAALRVLAGRTRDDLIARYPDLAA